MTTVRALCCLLMLEVGGGAYFVSSWLREPLPPQPVLTRLHAESQADLERLREATVTQGTREAWRELGEAYLLFGLLPEAEFCCQTAANLAPPSHQSLYLWGLALHLQGRTGEAIDRFRAAAALAALDPDHPDAEARCWYAIGRNLLREEKPSEAEAAFRRAVGFPPAQHQLARLLVRFQRAEEAESLLSEMIAEFPTAVKLRQLRAAARLQLGDAHAAAEDRFRLERCIEFLPSDLIVQRLHDDMRRFGLFRAVQQCESASANGRPEAAAEGLAALLEQQWQPQLAIPLASFQLELGRGRETVELADRLLQRTGVSPEHLNLKAAGLALLGQQQAAIEVWSRSAEIRGTEAAHLALAAHYEQQAGESQLAARHRGQALYFRGVTAYRADELSQATRDLEQAVELSANAHARYYLACCLLAKGDRRRAEETLQACLQKHPNHGRAARLLEFVRDSVQ